MGPSWDVVRVWLNEQLMAMDEWEQLVCLRLSHKIVPEVLRLCRGMYRISIARARLVRLARLKRQV